MKLLHFKLRPLSAWRTPWQADTLTGLLCWAAARLGERDLLEDGITVPALRGEPPFVLSDAFPGDLLPIPAVLRLRNWPEDQRKAIKRARWLSRDSFLAVRHGAPSLQPADLLPDGYVFFHHNRLRNTLDRSTQGTPGRGGLWPCWETRLAATQNFLSVYARVSDPFAFHLKRLFSELSNFGFGADSSAGLGQFELVGEPQDADWLDTPPELASGCLTLSSFQPAQHDPTEGLWEAFVKYGKLGPDFGLENVFKRPLFMLRPGACFVDSSARPFLGRAIPMDQLLPAETTAEVRTQGRRVVQFAYGIAVPYPMP